MFKQIHSRLFRARSRLKGVKPRILYIIKNYPQLSQTYIKSEINALLKDFDIRIIATSTPDYYDPEHLPFQHIADVEKIVKAARKFNPAVIHGHYLVHAKTISDVAQRLEKPFTIRAHSFDAIKPFESGHTPKHILSLQNHVNSELCLGILAFPFSRNLLEQEGSIRPEKIIDSPPVVDFHRFYNRQKNGQEVMNTGACIPKKQMQDFVSLASKVPQRTFNLYAIGHKVESIVQLHEKKGKVLNMISPIPYSQMPGAYKKHGWIVYTASSKLKTVGWPMALAEAQASGVIACMANIRPDIRDYLGDSGYIYEDIDEIISVLASPPDSTKRQRGFENARQYDINDHKHLLTDLWAPYLKRDLKRQ